MNLKFTEGRVITTTDISQQTQPMPHTSDAASE